MKKDTRLIRRVMIPVALGTAFSLFGDTTLYAVLPTHTVEAGVTVASLGILLSANRWIRLLSNAVVGWLVDRVPRKPLFVSALFLGVLSTALYALFQGFEIMLPARILWGISWSGIWIAGNAIVLDVTSETNRGRLVGLYNAAFFAGSASGAMLGGILTDAYGYQPALRIETVLSLIGAIIVLFALPETRHLRLTSEQEKNNNVEKESGERPPAVLATMLTIVAIYGVMRVIVAGMVLPTFGLYLDSIFEEGVVIFGAALGVSTVTGLSLGVGTYLSMFAVPLSGEISDRVGNRWRIVLIALVVGLIGTYLMVLRQPFSVLVGYPLLTIASGASTGLAIALLGDESPPAMRGRWLSITFTVGDLTSAIGPLLAFSMIERLDQSSVYWFSGATLLALFCAIVAQGFWVNKRAKLR